MTKSKTTSKKAFDMKCFEQVTDIINLMGQNKIAEIELETDDLKLKLKKNSMPLIQPVLQSKSFDETALFNQYQYQPNLQKASLNPNEEIVIKEEVVSHNYHEIVSPMSGTFYRAPSPTSLPFVKEDELVTEDQTVCIVEAMKMMNEIKAGISGKIVKVLVENAVPVDKGTVLFYMEKKP